MSELFGLSMQTIMVVLIGLFAVSAVVSAGLFVAGPMMFRMGLRNIRRRPAQSALIVAGLMLATTIVTAAFTTGDTLNYSVTRVAYDFLQRTDLSLHHFQSEEAAASGDQFYAGDDLAARLDAAFAGDPDIEGFMGFLFEPVPVHNTRTALTEPAVILAGTDPETMARFGGLEHLDGSAADLAALADDEVFANERAADELNIETGDVLQVFVQGEPASLRVAGIVREERATGGLEFGGGELPGMAAKLSTVQRLTGRAGQINSVSVALRGGIRGGVERSDTAAGRLEAFIAAPGASEQLGLGGAGFQVEKVKQDAVEGAKLMASAFTTIFLVLGLFSIASGVLLIFMIFVMLAAERQREMGITRAVGGLRIHLVQAFLAEGMVYALFAGLAGVALGVGFGFLVIIGGSKVAFGDDLGFVTAHVTARTLVVSFCLGWVMTFSTVLVSSVLVSRLNIVAAIRGQTVGAGKEAPRGIRVRWLLGALPILAIIPPAGLYLLLRRGFGLSRTWAVGPAGLIFGATLVVVGRVSDSSFLFSFGISTVLIAGALLVRKWGAGERLVWTATGALLAFYWLMPFELSDRLFGKFDNNGMEMFLLSGLMIVAALTLIIIYNARLLNAMYGGVSKGRAGYMIPAGLLGGAAAFAGLGLALGDAGGGLGDIAYLVAIIVLVAGLFSLAAQRFQGLAPALRMGIAYPLANRFRTGMTIAMFSLILFSITVMSVLNATILELFASDEGSGGWDVIVATNRNNPITSLTATLEDVPSFDVSAITAVGALTPIDDDRQKVRQAGHTEWEPYVVRAADDGYWQNVTTTLEARASGYRSDADAYAAMERGEAFALIEATAVITGGFSTGEFRTQGVTITDSAFEPFQVEIRNEASGKVLAVTVIGVYSNKIPAGLFPGLTINAETSRRIFGEPEFRDFLVRLEPGTDTVVAAEGIEAALVTQAVQAYSVEKIINDALGASRGLLRVLQLFMALGLVVGIAAIGVISMRSVVERRQQIGMLRAIGYERATVAWSFLFESAFVALMGIGSGVAGAVVLSRNLISSADFIGTEGLSLFVPWPEVIVFAFAAFGFALLMTWWPSRRAASVPIAEALRYE